MSRPARRSKPLGKPPGKPQGKPLSAPNPPLSPLPPPREAPSGLWRWALPLILALYLGAAALHLAAVPTGATGYQNAPDEAAHMRMVRAVGEGRLPTRSDFASDPQGYEWHQPPLYYGLASLLLPFGERGPRAFSVLCGLAAILLIYRAARLLFPDAPTLAALAAGIAALIPTHIAITSTVNNDALLEVCFSGFLLILIGAFLGGFTAWRAGWLGAVLGAALLTKATGLLLLPALALAGLLLWRAGEKPAVIARNTGWALLVAAGISGWWFARNQMLYGEPLPLRTFQEAFAGTAQARDVVAGKLAGLPVDGWGSYLLLVSQWTFQSFWAVYGTPRAATFGVPVFLPDQIYLLLGIVSLTMLAGLILLHLRRKTEMTQTQQMLMWVFFLVIGLTGLSFLAFILKYFQTQGRYLYPAMLPLCILMALGWRAVFPERYRNLASGLLLGLLGVITLAFLQKATFL